MAFSILSKTAYPVMAGDVVANCPVCYKTIPLTPRGRGVWEVLFHNGLDNTPCNGTARMARLEKIPNLRRV